MTSGASTATRADPARVRLGRRSAPRSARRSTHPRGARLAAAIDRARDAVVAFSVNRGDGETRRGRDAHDGETQKSRRTDGETPRRRDARTARPLETTRPVRRPDRGSRRATTSSRRQRSADYPGFGQYDNAILIHCSSESSAVPTWARVRSIASFTSCLSKSSDFSALAVSAARSASANELCARRVMVAFVAVPVTTSDPACCAMWWLSHRHSRFSSLWSPPSDRGSRW